MAAKRQNTARDERSAHANDASGASRVSKAAGSVGSVGSQKMRVEQRAGSPSSPIKHRASAQKPGASSSKRRAATPGAGAKRGTPGAPAPAPAPSRQPLDSHIIGDMHRRWQSLQPHHQQRVYSILLLLLSLLLFLGLTFWHRVWLVGQIGIFFVFFLGWGAYPLALGLIVFALAQLIEGMRNEQFLRWSQVIGLLTMLLLLLTESALLGGSGGVIGALLSSPLLKLPVAVRHVLVLGLLVLVAILTFRIRLSHVSRVSGYVGNIFADSKRGSATGENGRPSPYLGQRPQHSRYVFNQPSAQAGRGNGSRVAALADDDEDEENDDESAIDFEQDFDLDGGDPEDDPDNDINLHKQKVGFFQRRSRAPVKPLDPADHAAAVRGARQQPLPFDEANRQPSSSVRELEPIEPLVPNPKLAKQPRIVTRAAKPEIESPWRLCDTGLLNNPDEIKVHLLGDDTASLAKTIQETLRSFRVDAEVRPEDISIGPTIVRFGIRPTGKAAMKQDERGRWVPVKDASGNIVYEQRTRVSRIMALQNDIALVLEAKSIRMEAPVPGRPYVGVEIPNKNSRLVTLREILDSKEYAAAKAKSKLAMVLGKDVGGAVRVGDLARMPHLLIAGATGAGKSVCLNAIIGSFLTQATPDDVRLLMIDPKMVELNMYNGIPHLLSPVVTEVDKVVGLLKIAIAEMEKRYRLFSQLNVRNLDGYRKLRAERVAHGDTTLKNLPAIVIVIDELADLMMAAPEEVESLICRLAQLARATGIHLIIATQRPSVDVITGLIKANIPTRISFMVSSSVDSRTIIDMGGAERLLGRGDMLYLPADAGKPERIQGAFVADDEAERLVAYWKQQAVEHAAALVASGQQAQGIGSIVAPVVEPGWEVSEHISDEYELDDELFEQAAQVVQEYERASISLLQRRLRIGYSRAARLIDLLEERGVIGRIEPGGRVREVYDKSNRGSYSSEGRSMADEAADIIAEERAKEEFLKKHGNGTAGNRREDE